MKFLIICSVALLTACTPTASETTDTWKLPSELEGCTVSRLQQNALTYMNVVRCPNSTTTATTGKGKTQETVITIDGQTYVKADK